MTALAVSTPLLAVHLIAAAIWVGSIVALRVVVLAAGETLDPPARVAFFRALGRRYGMVGGLALVVALGTGLEIAGSPSGWPTALRVAGVLSILLLVATVVGVAQARAMTRLRRRAVAGDRDAAAEVRRGSIVAGVLRAGIALLTLAVVVLAAASVD